MQNFIFKPMVTKLFLRRKWPVFLRILPIVILLIIKSGHPAAAQKKLTTSRQSSYYTYIFKLNADEVEWLYKHPGEAPPDQIFHTVVDSFKTDSAWKNKLPYGNYLKIFALKNKIQYQLVENHSVTLHLLNNNHDLNFTITDNFERAVPKVNALVDGHVIHYDTASSSFHTRYSKNRMIVAVDNDRNTNFFLLKSNLTPKRKFLSKSWFQSKKYRLMALFRKEEVNYANKLKLNANSKYFGFIIFNKPVYKPRDTVRFKAFVLTKQTNKPVRANELIVRLKEDYDDNGKVLARIKSYRDGAFEYQFVLTDSLKLTLDNDYTISLEDPGSLKYNLDNYKGNDDDKFLAKRKIYIGGNFKYEDYELKTIHFNVRTDKSTHYLGEPLAVYLKAADENDLSVPDGRVTMILKTNQVRDEQSSQLFVPDTLWQHEVVLDRIGETKVIIPDSIFPKADIEYNIESMFLNANNERQFASNYIIFKHKRNKISAELLSDTLIATYYSSGKKSSSPAQLSAINSMADTVETVSVNLPLALKINHGYRGYYLKTDSADYSFNLGSFESGLAFSSYRTSDSIFVKIANPRKIDFSYWVFNGNKIIDKGHADSLLYRNKFSKSGNAAFLISYIWAGQNKIIGNSVPYQAKLLNIKVKQPFSVYPGQQVTTEIDVKDITGNPVANTDLTAWSLTKKFEDYKTPFVPYLGKSYFFRTKPPVNNILLNYNGGMRVDWLKQSKKMGLDSIAFYQFTHPTSVYKIEEEVPDTLTQIAPFLIKDGDIVPVHILYIDERPVYFSQAEQLKRYSFKVTPGVHTLRFRTIDKSIVLNGVSVEKNKKLILSLNIADTLNTTAHMVKMPDSLTRYEADQLNKYMIEVVNNFGWRMASIAQNDDIMLLNPNPNNYRYQHADILTGPLASNIATIEIKGKTNTQFVIEPGYSYQFEPNLLKQKSIEQRYPFRKFLSNNGNEIDDYSQRPLTRPEADSLWQQFLDLRSNTTPLFQNEAIAEKITGRLELSVKSDKIAHPAFIKNVIVYRNEDPDYIRVYPGNQTWLGNIGVGNYRILFLLKGDFYAIWDNIRVKQFGLNIYSRPLQILPKDSVSIKINDVIEQREGLTGTNDFEIKNDASKLKEAFNDKYLDPASLKDVMFGRVLAKDDRLPIPGVTVKIRGTNFGAVTDVNGRFQLKVPTYGKLVISFVGYQSEEVNIETGKVLEIFLEPRSSHLNEVVVTGYGVVKRNDIMGAVSIVNATAMGLSAANSIPGSSAEFLIRGNSTANTSGPPLIIVDGIPVESMSAVDPATIQEISVLKTDAARTVYGVRGANGVILISTKNKNSNGTATDTSGQRPPENALRKNFRDYAYWQPKLTTDENGEASFTSTFPDDITNWRTFVIGINGQRQSGFAEGSIKSFKPVSSNFISPLFAVEGDQMKMIGKVLNYNTEPVKLTRTFSYNNKTIKQDDLTVVNSKIDTLAVTTDGKDSLTFEYTIKRDNGYFDGERRKIPVVLQGTQETKGFFEALTHDTTVTFRFDPTLGPVTFRAEASLLPALLRETERLRNYQYLCNEQLASKLKGLLAEKRIRAYLNEPFKWDRNVKELINKLQANRLSNGTWGWWKDSADELWISLHAVEALLDADQMGYATQLDKEKLTAYLIYQMESYRGEDKLSCLQLLKVLNAKVDYQRFTGLIAKELTTIKDTSIYNQFRMLLLRQQAGLPVKADSLLKMAKHTLFGNLYWGEGNYRFFDNATQLSVLAYQILKNDGGHPEALAKIRGYLMEQRNDDHWRNTYETSLILESILPDLLKEAKTLAPPALRLSGAINDNIDKFPYTGSFSNNELSIVKTGPLPVYITGFQQFHNSNPEKVSKHFMVNTHFEQQGMLKTKLKGGAPVTLKVEVTAKADGDFVMIEIPIPAGCSYESKEQNYDGLEVHREYFKDKVSIFCRKLKQGNYTFTISLMPRYDGVYTLNPAKAELMYFPVFYGREGMKKVVIGE
jgi:TonB-dependent SusC/RagA subfamily outer membrane receptor